MDNRRLMDRHNLQVKTVLSFPDTPTEEARTLNVSGDGAFVLTSQTKPVGSKIFISLLAAASPDKQIRRKTVIDLEGIVRRITPYGMGICFDPCQCADDPSLRAHRQLEYATEIFYAD